MSKKTYISLHSKYTVVCEHSDCSMAATCLHRLAYSEMLKAEIYFSSFITFPLFMREMILLIINILYV